MRMLVHVPVKFHLLHRPVTETLDSHLFLFVLAHLSRARQPAGLTSTFAYHALSVQHGQ